MKIKAKLFTIVVLSALIPIIALGTIHYVYSENEISNLILNELESVADVQKVRINDNIDRNY